MTAADMAMNFPAARPGAGLGTCSRCKESPPLGISKRPVGTDGAMMVVAVCERCGTPHDHPKLHEADPTPYIQHEVRLEDNVAAWPERFTRMEARLQSMGVVDAAELAMIRARLDDIEGRFALMDRRLLELESLVNGEDNPSQSRKRKG